MRTALAVVGTMMAVGCSATHDARDAELGALLVFERDLARLQCERDVRCALDEAHSTISDTLLFSECWMGPVRQAEAREAYLAGRLSFDPAAAAECLDLWRVRGCGWASGPANEFQSSRDRFERYDPPACQRAHQRAPYECARGVVCEAQASCAGTTCVACVPWGAVGDTCADVRCRVGLTCIDGVCQAGCSYDYDCDAGDGADVACFGGECLAPARIDDPCAIVGSPPVDNCLEGYCHPTDHVCRPKAELGERCTDRPCAWGLECDAATLACVSLPAGGECSSPFGLGTTCSRLTPFCHRGFCDAEPIVATCRMGPDLLDQIGCADGYACANRAPGTAGAPVCVPMVPIGSACDEARACIHGSACRDGICRRRVTPWETCSADTACPPYLTCVGGRCTAPDVWPGSLELLESCRTTSECGAGQCHDGRCLLAPNGSPCEGTYRHECQNVCSGGVCVDRTIVGGDARCDPSGGDRVCGAGLACVGSGGPPVCRPLCR